MEMTAPQRIQQRAGSDVCDPSAFESGTFRTTKLEVGCGHRGQVGFMRSLLGKIGCGEIILTREGALFKLGEAIL